MDYKLPFPSLKYQTMVHIGSHVLNQRLVVGERCSGIRNLPQEFRKWSLLKENLSQVVDNLPLPQLLLSQLWNVIVEMYFQIWDWTQCTNCAIHRAYFKSIITNTFPVFCFDVHGEISQKKMMRAYIEKWNNVYYRDTIRYFVSACYWCLEDLIFTLWNQMSQEDRNRAFISNQSDLVVMYWLDSMGIIENGLTEAISTYYSVFWNPDYSTYENLMKHILLIKDNVSVQYFWHKLTDVEKARNAYDCAKLAASCKMKNLLCCALTYLNKDQQLEFLSKHSYAVSLCFLLWPFDRFFFPTLELVWNTLSTTDYFCLFEQIVFKMGSDYGGRFNLVLQEYWNRTPPQKKKICFRGRESVLQWLRFINNIMHLHQDKYQVLSRDIRALRGFPVRYGRSLLRDGYRPRNLGEFLRFLASNSNF